MEDALNARAFAAEESDTDDALLAEMAKSDAGAFGLLYERHALRVYRYVFHRVRDSDEADDVAAAVWMKVLEGIDSYRPRRGGFTPWLFRIAGNTVVDHYRRSRKYVPFEYDDQPASDGDPIAHALDGERAQELRALIAHLSPEQREVIVLRFAADLSFAEIAATVGKNEPAVRMLAHRGLRKLKTVIDDV